MERFAPLDVWAVQPGRCQAESFTGWVEPVNVCGFTALDIGCNAHRIERTYRDARLDSVDHYFAVFQVGGQSAMTHNDQAVRLDVAMSHSLMRPGL